MNDPIHDIFKEMCWLVDIIVTLNIESHHSELLVILKLDQI